MRNLDFSLGNIQLTIPDSRITQIELPVPISFASVGYSITGTPTFKGPQHEAKLTGGATALLTEDEKDKLRSLFWYSDKLRQNLVNPGILLIDTIQRFVELAPGTRAVAPGTAEIQNPDGTVWYFPQLRVWLTNIKPTFIGGRFYPTSFTWLETSKIIRP